MLYRPEAHVVALTVPVSGKAESRLSDCCVSALCVCARLSPTIEAFLRGAAATEHLQGTQ